MARQPKYWAGETPVETVIGNLVIKSYPKAGVVQFFNHIDNSASGGYVGLSKGVVVHLDGLTPDECQNIADAVQAAVEGEQDYRPKSKKVLAKR